MADTNRTQPREPNETERNSIPGSNDRDQAVEREGLETEHNRGNDEAAQSRNRGNDEQSEDIDPDSAESDVNRDDTIDEG